MAFFGAYAMIIITTIYYALPKLKGLERFNPKRGLLVFWITTMSMVVMGLSFGVAGVIQSYMQRGLGMDFLTVQGFMRPWFIAVFFGGIGLFIGVIIYIVDVLTLASRKN
jgi:nitric oxide reductase subunit B